MINIEAVVDDLIRHLRQNFRLQLEQVAATWGLGIPLAPVRPESYLVGDPTRYRGYQAPACFIKVPQTRRGFRAQNFFDQEHPMTVIYEIEGQSEEQLTRAAWRMGEAADACLHDQDLTPASATGRSMKIFVTGIKYDVTRASAGNVFRKRIALDLLVKHWDQMTPMAANA